MKVGRNDPCPCGSGKKHKHCCGQLARPAAAAAVPAELRELFRLVEAGELAEAEARTQSLLETQSRSGLLWKVLSVARLRQGKDALPALQRAAELLPNDAEAYANLGAELRTRGQFEMALGALRRSLTLEPRNPDALLEASEVQRALGRVQEALLLLQWALELAPQRAQIHNNMGNLLLALGRRAEAVSSYRRALQLQPRHAQLLANLANALREAGEFAEALECCDQALSLDPHVGLAHNNRGLLLAARGERLAAADSFRAALRAQPSYPEALLNLGAVLRELGSAREAVSVYQQAVALAPEQADAHEHLGRVLLEVRRRAEAAASFRRALELQPDRVGALSGLAMVLRMQHQADAAEAACRKALEHVPQNPEALSLLGELLADRGQFTAAEELFLRALAVNPDFVPAYCHLAANRKLTTADTEWLAGARRALTSACTLSERIHLLFALGKYYDDTQDFDQAFASFREAHELSKRQDPPYQPQRMSRLVERVIALHGRAHCLGQSPSELPVFIIGMPRSGTSLVEQILASHPAVFGAGEIRFWDAAFARLTAAEGREEGLRPCLDAVAREYLAELPAAAGSSARITDKMPANFLYAGLIHVALPGARFIHVQRDPLDTCVSVYAQNFVNGAAYAHELESLAHFYTEYRRLMAHWRKVLPAATLLEVPYEGLVAQPEHWARRMLEFLGLPWDERCLEFHQSGRVVITASKWQVRQRISSASVGRWRNYEKHIAPLVPLSMADAAASTGPPPPTMVTKASQR
jgi:tetratricopeptide (TPR) repeat protein